MKIEKKQRLKFFDRIFNRCIFSSMLCLYCTYDNLQKLPFLSSIMVTFTVKFVTVLMETSIVNKCICNFPKKMSCWKKFLINFLVPYLYNLKKCIRIRTKFVRICVICTIWKAVSGIGSGQNSCGSALSEQIWKAVSRSRENVCESAVVLAF
jgi:hypothetical protein